MSQFDCYLCGGGRGSWLCRSCVMAKIERTNAILDEETVAKLSAVAEWVNCATCMRGILVAGRQPGELCPLCDVGTLTPASPEQVEIFEACRKSNHQSCRCSNRNN